ncbi:hypothetical protein BJ546DRAFT_947876 [Cryomyces antarcticus]
MRASGIVKGSHVLLEHTLRGCDCIPGFDVSPAVGKRLLGGVLSLGKNVDDEHTEAGPVACTGGDNRVVRVRYWHDWVQGVSQRASSEESLVRPINYLYCTLQLGSRAVAVHAKSSGGNLSAGSGTL